MDKILTSNITRVISKTLRSVYDSPARISVLAFLILILSGTVLLSLPVSSTGKSIGFVDALFTATSAGCVTGLSVLDIAAELTLFGQAVLLCLIQVGGLGIMTLSTLFILLAGGKTSFSEQSLIKETYSHNGIRSPLSILSDVIKFTLIFTEFTSFKPPYKDSSLSDFFFDYLWCLDCVVHRVE